MTFHSAPNLRVCYGYFRLAFGSTLQGLISKSRLTSVSVVLQAVTASAATVRAQCRASDHTRSAGEGGGGARAPRRPFSHATRHSRREARSPGPHGSPLDA